MFFVWLSRVRYRYNGHGARKPLDTNSSPHRLFAPCFFYTESRRNFVTIVWSFAFWIWHRYLESGRLHQKLVFANELWCHLSLCPLQPVFSSAAKSSNSRTTGRTSLASDLWRLCQAWIWQRWISIIRKFPFFAVRQCYFLFSFIRVPLP